MFSFTFCKKKQRLKWKTILFAQSSGYKTEYANVSTFYSFYIQKLELYLLIAARDFLHLCICMKSEIIFFLCTIFVILLCKENLFILIHIKRFYNALANCDFHASHSFKENSPIRMFPHIVFLAINKCIKINKKSLYFPKRNYILKTGR